MGRWFAKGDAVEVTVPVSTLVTAGDFVELDGCVGFAIRTIQTDETTTSKLALDMRLDHWETSQIDVADAFAKGADVYWDSANDRFTTDPGGAPAAASVTIDPAGANNAVTYTARDAGQGGNGISIRYLGSTGNDVALAVAVNGNDIVVTPATDAGGLITSTADDVKAAIAADAEANALVAAADAAGNDGSGLVAATGPTNLAGGDDLAGDARLFGVVTLAKNADDVVHIKRTTQTT